MAKNKNLETICLKALSKYLIDNDPTFNLFCDGEIDLAEGIIPNLPNYHIDIDEGLKICIFFGNIIVYGYDFNGEIYSESAREVYNRAVQNTQKHRGVPFVETFMSSGIEEGCFGWYITSLIK